MRSNPAGEMFPTNSNRLAVTSLRSVTCFERTAAPMLAGGPRSPWPMSPSMRHGTSLRSSVTFARYAESVDLPVSVSPASITVTFLSTAKEVTCLAMSRQSEVPALV